MKKLFTAVIIMLLISTAASAGMLESLLVGPCRGGSEVGKGSHVVYINYCVQSDGFNTGIRITPDSRVPIKLYIFFFNGASPYAWKSFTVGPEGWTGLISELLPPETYFRSPSNVLISTTTTVQNPRFWVDQFVMSPTGFGFIQLEAEEVTE